MANNQVICHCNGVTKAQLKSAIKKGATNFEQLVLATKACTQCGSCAPNLHELLGEKVNWIAVEVAKTKSVAKDIKSFKLTAQDKSYQFDTYQPGQYILVKAYIDDQWVTRPYALASKRSETTFREVIVRKKTGGVLTEWLFDEAPAKELKITELQGTQYIDIASKHKSVCFAGGTGITPVISACRSIHQEKIVNPGYHIDYSVSDLEHVACKKELKGIIKKHPFISLHIRAEQIISVQEIVGIVHGNDKDTQYYVIGPNKFEAYVHKTLLKCGVPEPQINNLKEKSVATTSAQVPQVSNTTIEVNRNYAYLGLFLLCVFLIQEWLGLKIIFLQEWQLDENYKRWTGFLLLSFLFFQWYYPLKQFFAYRGNLLYWRKIHKYNGVVAPAILYVHSTTIGYAYLFVLSIAYLTNNALALCNRDVFHEWFSHKLVYQSWLSIHIFLSFVISILVWYHLFVAFAYS